MPQQHIPLSPSLQHLIELVPLELVTVSVSFSIGMTVTSLWGSFNCAICLAKAVLCHPGIDSNKSFPFPLNILSISSSTIVWIPRFWVLLPALLLFWLRFKSCSPIVDRFDLPLLRDRFDLPLLVVDLLALCGWTRLFEKATRCWLGSIRVLGFELGTFFIGFFFCFFLSFESG